MKKRTVAQNYEDSKVYTKMIDAIKAGTYAEEDFKKFVRKEEASGRIESLLSAFHAVIAEQIAAGYMGDKDEVVSGRINRYYDLIFETSSTAKVMRLDADNEAAERWEKKGLSWYVHEIPAPATYPKLLEYDGLRWILQRACERELFRPVNKWQLVWMGKTTKKYRWFIEKVTEATGLYNRIFDTPKGEKEKVDGTPYKDYELDWDGFAEIIINGRDMKDSAKTYNYPNSEPDGTGVINALISEYDKKKPKFGDVPKDFVYNSFDSSRWH